MWRISHELRSCQLKEGLRKKCIWRMFSPSENEENLDIKNRPFLIFVFSFSRPSVNRVIHINQFKTRSSFLTLIVIFYSFRRPELFIWRPKSNKENIQIFKFYISIFFRRPELFNCRPKTVHGLTIRILFFLKKARLV